MKFALSGVLVFIVALRAWVVLRAWTSGAPQEREATTAELLAALPPLSRVADEEKASCSPGPCPLRASSRY